MSSCSQIEKSIESLIDPLPHACSTSSTCAAAGISITLKFKVLQVARRLRRCRRPNRALDR